MAPAWLAKSGDNLELTLPDEFGGFAPEPGPRPAGQAILGNRVPELRVLQLPGLGCE